MMNRLRATWQRNDNQPKGDNRCSKQISKTNSQEPAHALIGFKLNIMIMMAMMAKYVLFVDIPNSNSLDQ